MTKKKVFYGISSKHEGCWGWSHRVYTFSDYEKALDWLNSEEYDFREREITNSKARAIKIAQSRKLVEEAMSYQALCY